MTAFTAASRYAGIETAQLERAASAGEREEAPIVYLRRRFVPPPERFALLVEHTVVAGERLDTIAADELGDPELFWQICDANTAIRPDELLEPGRRLRITLPEGIPGALEE